MSDIFGSFNGIHPSAFHASAGPVAPAEAQTSASGALRYQCPVTDAFILVTDDVTLETLGDSAHLRHRCPACSEMHLLNLSDDTPAFGLRARRG